MRVHTAGGQHVLRETLTRLEERLDARRFVRVHRSVDFNPTITPDGDTLLFASIGREGGFGYGDLYMTERVRRRWRPARNLGPQVNTAQDEYHPSLSPDGRTLYFVRHEYEPEYLPADLFHVRTRGLLWPHVAHDADDDSAE